jgi:thiamine kinase-like enzyme
LVVALDPILSRLESRLGAREGEPEPLDGGITNRNYRVVLGGRRYVLRIPASGLEVLGIDRPTESACARWAGEVGIGPPVVDEEQGCLVAEWVDGTPVEPGAVPGAALDAVADALRTVHDGPRMANTFNSFRIVEEHARFAGDVPPDYAEAHAAAQEIERELAGHPEHAPVPCHNDLLAGNLLWDGARLWLVDWDYAGTGDRFFDLANLSVNNELSADEEERLLERYFGEPATARRLRALRLMKVMSDFREAMWGVAQQRLSDLDFDYVAYAQEHFARLRKQLERAG